MDIKDLMTDDMAKVGEFEAACTDMIESRYILAEGRIIKIMQVVALSTVLQQFFGKALRGFDYAAEARQWGKDGFKLPATKKDHIALVFCILADIDNRKIYLNDFLRKFFWNGDINSAYSSFCDSLIRPFRDYVVNAFKGAPDIAPSVEQKAMNLAAVIEATDLPQNEKEEYIFMCDGIASSARSDISGARALAIGLKRLLIGRKETEGLISEIIADLGC